MIVSDFLRSVTEIRLPIGEISRVLSTVVTLPPLYGAPRRFWNRKFMISGEEEEGGCVCLFVCFVKP